MTPARPAIALSLGLTLMITGCVSSQAERPTLGTVLVVSVDAQSAAIPIDALRATLEGEQLAVNELAAPAGALNAAAVEDAFQQLVTEDPDVPHAIIAIGHGSSAVWSALPTLADEAEAAVFVGVPALMNLEVEDLTNTPILDLHATSDTETVTAHESMHAALAIAHVPHEMVVYDEVGPAFYDHDSDDWSGAYWAESRKRISAFLDTALFTDELLQVQ